MRRVSIAVGVVVVLIVWRPFAPVATLQSQSQVQSVAPVTSTAVRDWDNTTNSMLRTGELHLRLSREDTLIPGRTIEHLDQYHNGVPVWGGGITRQLDSSSLAISVLGRLYEDLAIGTEPALTPDDARDVISGLSGVDMGARIPELIILPLDGGGYALTYRDQAISPDDASVYFIDAMDGRVRLKYSLFQNQSAVVEGIGVLGDRKKVSVLSQSGTFLADDALRPPSLRTFDMRGNLTAAQNALFGPATLTIANLATDPSSTWTDGPNVDAHAFEGYTYDFYFKKFGRRGLDNQNTRIIGMTHTVRSQDFLLYPPSIQGQYFLNAFYCPGCGVDRRGMMVYGEGGGSIVFGCGSARFIVRNFAGSLDVVAHELSHGVTAYSSNLIYLNESGALNEAFSDIMGTSVEFFVRPATANYLIGEDLSTALNACFVRSLQDPLSFGSPDNYSIRFIGTADNGGVHINSTIASHAFYLAIEGGTNRTSQLAVQGVGRANREQIEKVFYRGFTQLPSNATFSFARAATIQAARELYGTGSAAERAVTQAWTAVGVN
jgi:Zn-dependent metalloprotease